MVDPIEIDLHHLVELSDRLFQKRLFPAQDTGTTDQNVQPAKVGNRLLDHRLDGVFIRHIGADVECFLPKLLDLFHYRLTLLIQHIGDHNIAAFFGNA